MQNEFINGSSKDIELHQNLKIRIPTPKSEYDETIENNYNKKETNYNNYLPYILSFLNCC
jgi:hypothetical protein